MDRLLEKRPVLLRRGAVRAQRCLAMLRRECCNTSFMVRFGKYAVNIERPHQDHVEDQADSLSICAGAHEAIGIVEVGLWAER